MSEFDPTILNEAAIPPPEAFSSRARVGSMDEYKALHSYALEKPERFDRFVLCYRETLPSGNTKYRTISHGCDLDQQIGMYQMGLLEAHEVSKT